MKNYIERSMTYDGYIRLIDELLTQGRTTGPNDSEQMVNYGKLNRQRMKRLGTTVEIKDAIREKSKNLARRMIWLIITEGWCGDAAQNIPVVEKIAAESPNIETRYLLRDENPELIDRFLTNGARSIPKLIALDAESLEVLGTWGPRPRPAMDYFYKMRDAGVEKDAAMENLQRWYLKDKERSIQDEFAAFLDELVKKRSASN